MKNNNTWSKKNQKHDSNREDAEENNAGSDGQSSSSNISEEDNKENIGGATSESKSVLNSNGKTRASRGSATDPQSLYARVYIYRHIISHFKCKTSFHFMALTLLLESCRKEERE